MTDFGVLPDNLPVPQDDGAADHLPGQAMPSLTLKTSDDAAVNLGDLGPGERSSTCTPSQDGPEPICRRDGTQSQGLEAAPPRHVTSGITSPNLDTQAQPASSVCPARIPHTRRKWLSGYIFRSPCFLILHSTWQTHLACPHLAPPATTVSTRD